MRNFVFSIASAGPWVGVIALATYVRGVWDRIPERMATHLDFFGQPDGWGARTPSLTAIAVVILLVLIFFTVMVLVSALRDKRDTAYMTMLVAMDYLISALLIHGFWFTIRTSMGQSGGLFPLADVPLLVALIACAVLLSVRKRRLTLAGYR